MLIYGNLIRSRLCLYGARVVELFGHCGLAFRPYSILAFFVPSDKRMVMGSPGWSCSTDLTTPSEPRTKAYPLARISNGLTALKSFACPWSWVWASMKRCLAFCNTLFASNLWFSRWFASIPLRWATMRACSSTPLRAFCRVARVAALQARSASCCNSPLIFLCSSTDNVSTCWA